MIGNVKKYFTAGHQVWRASPVADAWGGMVDTPALITTVSGRIRPLSGDVRLSADKKTAFATHRFYCFPADIRAGDEIRTGGQTYRVNFAGDIMTFGRFMQVDMELVI